MNTSILSRSVIAAASLAIGSVALAAVPATAATSTGVTRDQVLAATAAVRNIDSFETFLAAEALARQIAAPSCGIAADDDAEIGMDVPAAGQSADGLLAYVTIDQGEPTERECAVAVVVTADPALALSGTLRIDATTTSGTGENLPVTTVDPVIAQMSGDAFVTPPLTIDDEADIYDLSFTANGSTTRAVPTTTSVKVRDKKTASEKKAARTKYDKRVRAAKKKYAKAVDKAGSSKSRKTAAKKAYKATRATAKAKYKRAVAGYKIVTKQVTVTESRPFSLRAEY